MAAPDGSPIGKPEDRDSFPPGGLAKLQMGNGQQTHRLPVSP